MSEEHRNNREIFLKRKEDHKKALLAHKQAILKSKKDN